MRKPGVFANSVDSNFAIQASFHQVVKLSSELDRGWWRSGAKTAEMEFLVPIKHGVENTLEKLETTSCAMEL